MAFDPRVFVGNPYGGGGAGGGRGGAAAGYTGGYMGHSMHAGAADPYTSMTRRMPMGGGFAGGAAGRPGITQGRVRGGGRATPGSVPQLPYQPNAPRTQGLIDPLQQAGAGLLDPESAYSQRLREGMVEDIGDQTEAMKRAAVLNAARAGFGTGAGAELLETQGDIGRAGMAAQGDALADFTLQAPKLGAQIMAPALSAQLGLQGQNLQAYLTQQNLARQQEADQLRADMEQARMAQEAFFRELDFMGLGF